MNNETEAVLTKFLVEATRYLERLNGQEMLPLAAPAASKPGRKPKAEAKPEPAPAPEKKSAVEALIEQPAAKPAPAALKRPDIAEFEVATRVIKPEESLPLAIQTAKEFVQRFQNAKPEDGLQMARRMMAEVFKVGKISDMSHEARIEFIALLEKKMTEAA